jgi:hypothetical protein
LRAGTSQIEGYLNSLWSTEVEVDQSTGTVAPAADLLYNALTLYQSMSEFEQDTDAKEKALVRDVREMIQNLKPKGFDSPVAFNMMRNVQGESVPLNSGRPSTPRPMTPKPMTPRLPGSASAPGEVTSGVRVPQPTASVVSSSPRIAAPVPTPRTSAPVPLILTVPPSTPSTAQSTPRAPQAPQAPQRPEFGLDLGGSRYRRYW